jgi:hypothetical protein
MLDELSGCLAQHSVIIRQQNADLACHGIPLPPCQAGSVYHSLAPVSTRYVDAESESIRMEPHTDLIFELAEDCRVFLPAVLHGYQSTLWTDHRS